MPLDLHDIFVGIGSLVDKDVSGGSAYGDMLVSMLIPGELTDASLGDARSLILSNSFPAIKPAFILQAELKDLDGCVKKDEQSLPPVAKWVQLLLKSIEETLLWILQPCIRADIMII
jgi:hypothetical protein